MNQESTSAQVRIATSRKRLEPLEIFFGDANQAAARVYARLDVAGLPAGCTLTGRLVGPKCEYSHTLSASVPFMAKKGASPDKSEVLLSEAMVPDPCFWSSELPFLYQAQIELRCAGDVLATEVRPLGIRPLGAQRRRLVLEGRTWVMRAADARELPPQMLHDWRAADLAMQVERPSDALCSEASRLGVFLIAEVTGDHAALANELQRLSRQPAVAVAVLRSEHPLDKSIRAAARNLLMADIVDAGNKSSPSEWADLVICEAATGEALVNCPEAFRLPVLARRRAGWRSELADLRGECDRLQRDLAGHGDFAGYLV